MCVCVCVISLSVLCNAVDTLMGSAVFRISSRGARLRFQEIR